MSAAGKALMPANSAQLMADGIISVAGQQVKKGSVIKGGFGRGSGTGQEMSLIELVDIVDPEELTPVHFIAIGGVSMSSIAELFAERGMQVSGCDHAPSSVLDRLSEKGIEVFIGHDPSHLNGVRGVVVSSAIGVGNPELQEAKKRGLNIWHRSAALASLMQGKSVISVAGTHGKTSTTGMISVILSQAGLAPSYAIGAPTG